MNQRLRKRPPSQKMTSSSYLLRTSRRKERRAKTKLAVARNTLHSPARA